MSMAILIGEAAKLLGVTTKALRHFLDQKNRLEPN